mgnify:FL=1
MLLDLLVMAVIFMVCLGAVVIGWSIVLSLTFGIINWVVRAIYETLAIRENNRLEENFGG